jgi:hypothetical protein
VKPISRKALSTYTKLLIGELVFLKLLVIVRLKRIAAVCPQYSLKENEIRSLSYRNIYGIPTVIPLRTLSVNNPLPAELIKHYIEPKL